MALTRNFLKSMGLTDEQVSAIIENHSDTVEGLKKERDAYKAEAEKVEELTTQLNEANDKLAKAGDSAKIQKEFDDYKAGIEAEKTNAKKRGAMDALLRDKVGIERDSARRLILDAMSLDAYELGENDQFKDPDTITADMKEKHAEWIGKAETKGVPPATPPSGGGTKITRDQIRKMTPEEINANWDSVKAALAQKGE